MINVSIINNLSEPYVLNFENNLTFAVSITRNFIFPCVCSFAVVCCFIICFIIAKTGVKRASKVYIFLLAATDIIQSFGLIS